MKKIKLILATVFTLLIAASCSKTEQETTYIPGEMTEVEFDLDASDILMDAAPLGRSFSPSYNNAGFTINAFRKDESDSKFKFVKAISGSGLTYNAATKKLTGKHTLQVGSYKFYITYGAGQSQLTQTAWTVGTEWNKAGLINCSYGTTGIPSELFLQLDKQTSDLTEYVVPLTGTSPKVQEKLKRAVARVDVLFISATKSGTTYTEKAYNDPSNPSRNIIDNRTLQLGFNMGSLPSRISRLGVPSNTPVTTTANVVVNYELAANTSKVTIGSATANKVGASGFTAYDNIQATDVINKGAHIFGTYFLPFESAATTTSATLTVTGKKSATDILKRTIPFTGVPLEQNKVTLLKVYVIGDGKTVFDSDVQFEVEVITDWNGFNAVETEIN